MSNNAERLRVAAVTLCGAGFAPFASGTFGSLAALAPFVALASAVHAAGAPSPVLDVAVAAGVLLSSVVSVRLGGWAVARFGRSDPKPFVLDEFAGQWTALLWLPASIGAGPQVFAAAVTTQFVLFRVFDILKPPPARQAERLPRGWGILIDDVLAGLYANGVGQIVWRLTPVGGWLVGAAAGT